jgi:hypothetical protein
MGASAGKDVQVQTVDKSKMKKSVSMVLPTDSPEHKLTVSSIKLAREMLWTRKNFFTFPHPVNVVDARIHALCTMTGVTLHCALMYFADFPYMYIWLGYGFLARTLCGPRIDPQVTSPSFNSLILFIHFIRFIQFIHSVIHSTYSLQTFIYSIHVIQFIHSFMISFNSFTLSPAPFCSQSRYQSCCDCCHIREY